MTKKIKSLNLIQLILNILIVGAVGAGLVLSFIHMNNEHQNIGLAFKYYYVWSAIICAVAAFPLIVYNIKAVKSGKDNTPKFLLTLAFIGALMSIVTLIFSLVAIPMKTYTFEEIFSINDGELLLNIIIPILSIANLLFFEIVPTIRFRIVFVPLLAFILYCACIFGTMTYYHLTGGEQGIAKAAEFAPYDFFKVIPEWAKYVGGEIKQASDATKNIVVLAGFIVASFGLSIFNWCINRIVSHIVIGVRYEEEPSIPESALPSTPNGEENQDNQDNVEAKPVEENPHAQLKFKRFDLNSKVLNDDINNNPGNIYHISYANRKLKTWKVKAENAGRAVKIFSTQKEAIIYAKELIAKNGGSIRIHSMAGKMRKDFFSTETAPVVTVVQTLDENNNTLKVEKIIEDAPAKVEALEKEAAKEPYVEEQPVVEPVKEEVKVEEPKEEVKETVAPSKTVVVKKTANKKVVVKSVPAKKVGPSPKKAVVVNKTTKTTSVNTKPAAKKAAPAKKPAAKKTAAVAKKVSKKK